MAAQEQAQIAASSTQGRAARADPKQPVDGSMLFAHGPEFGLKFGASMTHLHFTDPAKRDFGAASQDRVHKTFFFGNKHIDFLVPVQEPNPRHALEQAKAPAWNGSKPFAAPCDPDMYASVALKSWGVA